MQMAWWSVSCNLGHNWISTVYCLLWCDSLSLVLLRTVSTPFLSRLYTYVALLMVSKPVYTIPFQDTTLLSFGVTSSVVTIDRCQDAKRSFNGDWRLWFHMYQENTRTSISAHCTCISHILLLVSVWMHPESDQSGGSISSCMVGCSHKNNNNTTCTRGKYT
jgi:hypothetical protein